MQSKLASKMEEYFCYRVYYYELRNGSGSLTQTNLAAELKMKLKDFFRWDIILVCGTTDVLYV